MLPRAALLLTALILTPTTAVLAQRAHDKISVSVSGEVQNAGALSVAPGDRLSTALIAARPTSSAYLLGASFLSEKERRAQTRTHAGLVHNLSALRSSSDDTVSITAANLLRWMEEHPATGRKVTLMDARLLQAQRTKDPEIETGDSVNIPARPTTVRVMGAVDAECELAHVPMRDAKDYLRECRRSGGADRNDLFIIQPDGLIQRIGIALWNRADPQPVAPGGTIYVPIKQPAATTVDANFNAEFASFIATQAISP